MSKSAGMQQIVQDIRKMQPLDLVEKDYIVYVVMQCGGNLTEAGKRLGITRRTLLRHKRDWPELRRIALGRGEKLKE